MFFTGFLIAITPFNDKVSKMLKMWGVTLNMAIICGLVILGFPRIIYYLWKLSQPKIQTFRRRQPETLRTQIWNAKHDKNIKSWNKGFTIKYMLHIFMSICLIYTHRCSNFHLIHDFQGDIYRICFQYICSSWLEVYRFRKLFCKSLDAGVMYNMNRDMKVQSQASTILHT